jgi:hypothetical protein
MQERRIGPAAIDGEGTAVGEAAADLLFAAGVSIAARDPSNPLAYRNGGLADMLTLVSYFWLSFGLLHFPLDAPLFHRGDTSRAGSELDSIHL